MGVVFMNTDKIVLKIILYLELKSPMFLRNQWYTFWIKYRKGYCHMCGSCCGKCKYLKDNKCSIYKYRKIISPACISEFPRSPFELYFYKYKNACSHECTYYWFK